MQALINALIVAALEGYSDRLGNDGCNDMYLPNTPENYELVKATLVDSKDDDHEPHLSDNKKTIYTMNIDIVDYVKDQFIKQNNVDAKQVKALVKQLNGYHI